MRRPLALGRACAAVAFLVAGIACSKYASEEPPIEAPARDSGTEADDAANDAANDDASAPDDPADDLDAATVGDGSLIPEGGRIVFVTSTNVKGGVDPKGRAKADEICLARAQAGGRAGEYVAYLRIPGETANARLPDGGRWYRLDGERVFAGLPTTTNAERAVAINELGKPVADTVKIWTGQPSGAPSRQGDGDGTCNSWTSDAGRAMVGLSGDPKTWSNWTMRDCALGARLYCFER
jgi:hypothetical protein